EARARAVEERAPQLAAEVRARIAGDGDVVEVPGGEARVGEAPGGSERGEAGAVLDAVEALLLGGRDELAVDDERRRRVAVVRVQAENRRHRGIPDADLAEPPYPRTAAAAHVAGTRSVVTAADPS